MMNMRVGGIASGMDIEGMVKKLMEAERMPLNRMYQQQQTLEWKRDAFREINSKLLDLDKIMLDMKLSTTYKPRQAISSQSNAVTATATTSAANGTYEIKVTQLATNEMNVYKIGESSSTVISGDETVSYTTYDEEGNPKEHSFEVKEGDSLETVLKKFNESNDGMARAFLDKQSNQIVFETTRTGKYNNDGPEIDFGDQNFFENTLQLEHVTFVDAKNAKFTYNNGLELESKNNHYTLNGITFEFNNTTDENARITVSTDVEESFDKIMNFIDKYNEAIDVMNASQLEKKNRDFPPLTEEQKEDMTEDQIKKWEEKAKSGLLRGESTISNGMLALRQSLQSVVDTDAEYKMLNQIGITLTKDYLDGGKLEVTEANKEKLKAALRENPDDVFKLFSNPSEGSDRGLIQRFDDALDATRDEINQTAGKSTQVLDNYALGKQMKDLNERIDTFEKRMMRVEQRYWNQFTQMEKAIARLNQQSDYLFSQFNMGM